MFLQVLWIQCHARCRYRLLLDGQLETADETRVDAPARTDVSLTHMLGDLLSRFPAEEYAGEKLLFVREGHLWLSSMAGSRVHEHLGCFLPGLMMLGVLKLPDRCVQHAQ
jgi:hypothetical protein